MERPVDATWLKRRVIELSTHPLNGWDSLGVMALIESAPTLRNPEYATAEWIKTKNNSGYKCSACGAREKISAVVNGTHKFCYHCGAEMVKKGGMK